MANCSLVRSYTTYAERRKEAPRRVKVEGTLKPRVEEIPNIQTLSQSLKYLATEGSWKTSCTSAYASMTISCMGT